MAHRAAAGTSPKRTTGGPQTGGRPHPAAGPLGGPPPGEVGLGAGGARTQARPPTPRQGGRSQRPGHRPHGRAPRRGGCGPPHPGGQQRDRTQADHGPGAPPPATSPHQRRRGRPGRGRTRPGRCDGAGAAGPGQYRPGLHPTGRIPFFVPARHLWGRAGTTATGAAPPAGRFAPETAGGPRGPGAAAYGQGLTERGAADSAPGGGGGTDRSRGHPSRSWGGVGGKKKWPGGLPPPAGHDWTKKKCGEDALSPPLAVTADTRYPPVRRSSPKRTRCRPVPCALAMRRLPRPPSCLP